ncbi:hypothetical protein BCV70DRAFT_18940 [Testicularia cyperi]|uniref:Uncharacterized protein n=1 Tax=Testicularia cyperi TaxID=1882483 RepID=A0A317XZ23_9BASI|nr:hypothetical protein BCV70DRAFT_18940 [Testicularia cyperi]
MPCRIQIRQQVARSLSACGTHQRSHASAIAVQACPLHHYGPLHLGWTSLLLSKSSWGLDERCDSCVLPASQSQPVWALSTPCWPARPALCTMIRTCNSIA